MRKSLVGTVIAWVVLASVNATTSNKGVFLELQNLLMDYDFERSTGDQIEFRVLVTGNPPLNIVWLDNHGFRSKEIPFSKNDGRNSGNQLTTLKINNITSNDIGEYVLRADNGHLKKEITFRLLVIGKPKFDVWINGTDITFEVTSYPASVTSCYKTKCNETSCDEERKVDDYSTHSKRPSKIKEVTFIDGYQFRDNTTVRCVAKNAVDNSLTQVTAKLTNDHSYAADMHISYTEKIQPDGRFGSLECGAYHSLYSDNVLWFKDGKLVETSDDILVERDRNFFFETILHWDARVYEPSGVFKCQATRVNGSFQEKVWSLNNQTKVTLSVIIDAESGQQGNNTIRDASTEVITNAKRLESVACHPHLFKCKTVGGCEFNKWVCEEKLDCPTNFNAENCPLSEDDEAPLITPNQRDITVLPGDSLKLTCASTEPVTWKYDDYIKRAYDERRKYTFRQWKLDSDLPSHFDPEITHTADGDKYKSTIELNRIQFTFVGYYYCIKNSSKDYEMSHLLKTKKASRIYLFVEDLIRQVVLADQGIINDNSNFVIPCKPTSKNVLVQLRFDSYSYVDSDETYAYSEYEGFKPTARQFGSGYQYECLIWDQYSYSKKRQYNADSAGSIYSPPVITSTSMVGRDLQVECVVKSFSSVMPGLNITWMTPNANVAQKENRTKVETSQTHAQQNFTTTSKLTLKNVDEKKDIGKYECVLGVGSNQILSTYYHFKRPNNGNQFIRLWDDNSESYWGESKGHSKEFVVNFKGNPTPKIGWLGIDGKEIPWSDQVNYEKKVVATKTSDSGRLRFNNLTFDDFGYYTFFAENEQERKEKIIQLKVKGDPEIRMKKIVYVKPGQNATIDVDIISYPRAFRKRCFFTPCEENGYCYKGKFGDNRIKLSMHWVHQSEIKQWTKLLLSTARNGTVLCEVDNGNSKNQTEVTTEVIVSDYDPNASNTSKAPTLEEKPSLLTSVRRIFDYLF